MLWGPSPMDICSSDLPNYGDCCFNRFIFKTATITPSWAHSKTCISNMIKMKKTYFMTMAMMACLSLPVIVRCQIKVHNCKYSYLCCNIILLFSEILLLIEFCFIISLIFLIFSPCPKYTSLGVRLSNDS